MSTRPPEFVAARVGDQRGVADALDALRRAGVPRDRIEVLSEVPVPEAVLGGPMRHTRVLRYTFTGLVVGLVLGGFFSIGTVFLYPLLVGGQPYVAPPALIIIYELTMFCIVVFTVAGFVKETRVVDRRPYWSGVTRGETFVVVDVPPDLVSTRIRAALEARGAEVVEAEEELP